MKNLEQIRAAAALETAPRTSKAAVSKLPAMILANGLLAACAFACESKEDGKTPNRPEQKAAMDGTAVHLANPLLGISELNGCKDGNALMLKLCSANSLACQRATTEALAFISYVKRFTTKEGKESEGKP